MLLPVIMHPIMIIYYIRTKLTGYVFWNTSKQVAGAWFGGLLLNHKNPRWLQWLAEILDSSSVSLQTAEISIDFLVLLFVTREAAAPLSNILSCQAYKYCCLDTKIYLLFMQWDTEVGLRNLHKENSQRTDWEHTKNRKTN